MKNVEKVKNLIRNGTNVNEIDGHGNTALYNAVWYGHVEIVSICFRLTLWACGSTCDGLDKQG